MSVTFNAKMTAGNSSDGDCQQVSNATSISSTGITVAAGATMLVVTAVFTVANATHVSAISGTWDGVPLTLGPVANAGNNGKTSDSAILTLYNPTPGNKTLVVQWTNAADCYISAVAFNGSGDVLTADNQSNVLVDNITVPSSTDGATVAVGCKDADVPTMNQTPFWSNSPLGPGAGGSYALGGTSNNHSFAFAAGNAQSNVAVHIPAAGGGTTAITGTQTGVAVSTAIGQIDVGGTVAITGTQTGSATGTSVGPVLGFAPKLVAVRGQRNNNGTGATAVVTLTNPTLIAVGNYLIARVSVDNSGSSGARPGLTMSDSRGHTWTAPSGALQDPGAASAGIAAYLVYVKVVTPFQAGDTVTFTWTTGTPRSAIVIEEWANIHPTTPQAVAQLTGNNVSSTAQPSIARTPTAAGQLMYAMCAVEGRAAGWGAQDSDTTDGSWSDVTKDTADSGSDTTSVSVYGGYKVVNGTNAQTWNNTITSGWDWAAVAMVFAGVTSAAAVEGTQTGVSCVCGSGVLVIPDNVTGTQTGVAVTTAIGQVGPDSVSGVQTGVVVTTAIGQIGPLSYLYPASISGRKLLDQNGNVYLARTFSSWGLYKCTDAQITQALEGLAARGFNGVTVWYGGGFKVTTEWAPYYQNDDGENYWTGTAWQSSFGPAWGTIDWIVSEAARLGMVVHLSLGVSWGTSGIAADIGAASDAQLRQVGITLANRYINAKNIVWHVMYDDNPSYTSGKVEALFGGINDTEGATTRPVRWCEADEGSSTNERGLLNTGQQKMSINCQYEYGSNSIELVETTWAEVGNVPIGDCEPPYDGSGHYGGNEHQQLRERAYAVFLEGGCLLNHSHEGWWGFGRHGTVADNEGLTWQQVITHSSTYDQEYATNLFNQYLKDLNWAPTSSFVTTGEGTGDTKAAVGASPTAAIAYFPSSRSVQVNTTIITGTGNVRLRWYDPTNGSYTTITASEAQQSGRTVTYPGNNSAGVADWVLVVDLAQVVVDITGTQTGVDVSTAIGQIGGQGSVLGTQTGVAVATAIGQLTADTAITGTQTGVACSTAIGQIGIPGVAAFSHVQTPSGGVQASGTSVQITIPSVTAGNMLILYWRCPNGRTVTITDDKGNSWHSPPTITATDAADGTMAGISYATGVAAGTTIITFAISGASSTLRCIVSEWDYTGNVTVDRTAGAGGSTSPAVTASVSPTVDGELFAAVVQSADDSRTFTAGQDFTKRTAVLNGGGNERLIVEDFVQTTAASHIADMSYSGGATTWSIALATFKTDVGGSVAITGTQTGVAVATEIGQIVSYGPITGLKCAVVSTTSVGHVGPDTVLYPKTISGRKLLDQNGKVFLSRVFASWGMFKLTNANITTALEALAPLKFNGIMTMIGGGYRVDTSWLPYYENNNGQNYWTGTPWQSSLGPAWATIDWIVSECNRLGLVAHLNFYPSWGTTGPALDMLNASTAQMYDVGVAIANRYINAPNVVWCVGFDDTPGPGSALGQRIEALFHGINDAEGVNTRPFRWTEVNNGASTNGQGWFNTTYAKFSINCLYSYQGNSVEQVETVYSEIAGVPIGDCEPPYDAAGHYGGNQGQQLRERSYALFLEGGCHTNWCNEHWWSFGLGQPVPGNEGLTWSQVPTHNHVVQQQWIWELLDQYVADLTWVPTSAFVTTGEGTGDTKAAIGKSDTAAIAYFPDSRTVVVDTTILTGSGNVRLRWHDPYTGNYTTIAASEAQQSGRSIAYPSAHADSTNDWVLVVDLVGQADITGTQTGVAVSTAIGQLTATTAITGTQTGVAVSTAVGQISSTIPITGTQTGVSVGTSVGQISATTTVIGTQTGISVATAVGVIGVQTAITGTQTGVAVATSVGAVSGQANVTGTQTGVNIGTSVGSVSGQANIIGTQTGSATSTSVGVATGHAAITGTQTGVSIGASVGQLTANTAITGVQTGVDVGTGIGTASSGSVITGVQTGVAVISAIGQLTADTPVTGLSTNVVVSTEIAPVYGGITISGTSTGVVVTTEIGVVSGQANITGTQTGVNVSTGIGQLGVDGSISGTSITVDVSTEIGIISVQTNVIGLSTFVISDTEIGIVTGGPVVPAKQGAILVL